MHDRITSKWRPPLIVVLGGALSAVLGLPLAGVIALRMLQDLLGYRHAAILVMIVVAATTVLLGYLLWRLLYNPITALAATARAVQSGAQVSGTAPPQYGTRELGDLGQSVLGMARSLQDREATIRSFADHVTHEMKTPLTVMRAAAELLADSPLNDADARLLASISAAVVQMQADLTALQKIAAARAPSHHGTCNLEQILPQLRAEHPDLLIAVSGGDLQLPMAASGMMVVLGQLLCNAAQHGAEQASVFVTSKENATMFFVQDDGIGISAGNRARIFDPFFSTRKDLGGTGMGLAIVQALLGAHGAAISLLPTDDTKFQIVFADHLPSGLI